MKIDTQALALLIEEAGALSSKPKWTKQDEHRNAYLLSAISAVKNGVSLKQIEQDRVNDAARSMGINPTAFNGGLTDEQEIEARGWQNFLKHSPKAGNGPVELRDMTEGSAAAISRIGTYTGLGFFVPTGFVDQLWQSLAEHDFLFNPADATVIRTSTGVPLPVPLASDVENIATLVTGEPVASTSTDIAQMSHVTLGAYSFSSPRFVVSIEAADQDLQGSLSIKALANRFFADRLARGISKYLVAGTGSNQPTGLLQALENTNCPAVIAAGSSVNDGIGANDGTNSLGTPDFAAAFQKLNAAYLKSDKIAWAMNIHTLGQLMSIVAKSGKPVIDFVDGAFTILGIPIKICPTLSNCGPSNTPVVLGDFSYMATRLIFDETSGIQVLREAPGLAENGNVALKVFCRADSNILYQNDINGNPPFVSIVNHS